MEFVMYTDGGARNNPGPAAIGVVIFDGDGNLLKECSQYIGEATCNVAEYQALLKGLELILGMAGKAGAAGSTVECYSDSRLMVNQMNGDYKVKSEGLKALKAKAGRACLDFKHTIFIHVRRETAGIVKADKLVNLALDAAT